MHGAGRVKDRAADPHLKRDRTTDYQGEAPRRLSLPHQRLYTISVNWRGLT